MLTSYIGNIGEIEIKLEKFENDELYSHLLEYFYEQWIDISEEVENKNLGIGIINHRVLINDINNEYIYNSYSNDNNRKTYIRLLNELLQKDYLTIYNNEIQLIKEFLEKKDFEMVYIISEKLSTKLQNNNFVIEIYSKIEKLLFNKEYTKDSRKQVKELTKEIIIDLVTFGLNIKEIKNLLIEAFKSYTIIESDIYVGYLDKLDDLSDEKKVAYLDNININERLNCFKKHLYNDKKEYYFIFPLFGLRGPFKKGSFLLNNATVYHPDIYESPYSKDIYFMNFDNDNNDKSKTSTCYVEIKIFSNSAKAGQEKAINELNNVINILNFYYSSKRTEIFWDGQIMIFNSDYSPISSTMPLSNDTQKRRWNLSLYRPVYLLNDNYEDLKNINSVLQELENRNMNFEYNTLLNIIGLLAKTKYQSDEDKIIYYWSALEGLSDMLNINNSSKIETIKQVLTNIYYRYEQYRPIHNLFDTTVNHLINNKNRKILNMPDEFIKATYLDKAISSEGIINIIPFFNRIDELVNYTVSESYKDEINYTIQFYKNNNLALETLTNKEKEVILTIDYIYKTRNQIVHNGFIDRSLVPFLVKHLEAYSSSYFNFVIETYNKGSFNLNLSAKELMYDCKLLEKRLRSKRHYEISLDD